MKLASLGNAGLSNVLLNSGREECAEITGRRQKCGGGMRKYS